MDLVVDWGDMKTIARLGARNIKYREKSEDIDLDTSYVRPLGCKLLLVDSKSSLTAVSIIWLIWEKKYKEPRSTKSLKRNIHSTSVR